MDLYNHPPEQIPAHLISEYTMGNKIPVQNWYLNGKRSTNDGIVYTTSAIDCCLRKITEKKTFYYGATDFWLYQALEYFSIRNKDVVVIGSETPIYESMAIYYGARPTTVEYNRIISNDARLKTMLVEEFKNHPQQYDAAFSISSLEHDGLGRYGDPLKPNGDLETMRDMQSIIKADGLFFLSVPVGPDTLVWNAHRIYGPLRLPKLLSGWRLCKVFPSIFSFAKSKKILQPIFVLQNSREYDPHLKWFIMKFILVLESKRILKPLWSHFRNKLLT